MKISQKIRNVIAGAVLSAGIITGLFYVKPVTAAEGGCRVCADYDSRGRCLYWIYVPCAAPSNKKVGLEATTCDEDLSKMTIADRDNELLELNQ